MITSDHLGGGEMVNVSVRHPDLCERSNYIARLHSQIQEDIQTTILGKEFIISPGVFSPVGTFASELLAKNLIVNEGDIVLDLGTGIGIQAIFAAQQAKRIVATDVNKIAVLCAIENVKRNYLEHKIEVREGDLFQPVQHDKFDLIIWNPPYLPLEPHSILEQSWCCGSNNELIDRFFTEAKEHLTPGGRIQMVYSTLGNISYLLYKAEKDSPFCVEVIASMIGRFEVILVFVLTPL